MVGHQTTSHLLRESILQLCKASVPMSDGIEVDGIVCITIGNDTQQIVVKVHEKIHRDSLQGMSCKDILGEGASQKPTSPPIMTAKRQNVEDADTDVFKKRRLDPGEEHGAALHTAVLGTAIVMGDSEDVLNEEDSPDTLEATPVQVHSVEENVVMIEPLDEEDIAEEESDFMECEICHLLLPTNQDLLSHLKIVHDGHMCAHCDKPFLSSEQLKQHIMTHTASSAKELASPSIIRQSPPVQQNNYRGKVNIVSDMICVYKCGVCGEMTESEQACEEHMKYEHENEHRFLCVPCQEYFPNRAMFVVHRRMCHVDQYEILCQTCLVGFQEVEFPRHKIDCCKAPIPVTIPSGELHQTSSESVTSSRRSSSSNPVQKNGSATASEGKSKTRVDNILPFMMAQLKTPIAVFGSDQPSTSTGSPTKWAPDSMPAVKEENDSSNEGPSVSEAGKPRSQRVYLSSQPFIGRIAPGPFRCNLCDQLCTDMQEYDEHNFTAHYRYVCPCCAQTFASRRNLRRHVRKHTGEKPYSCDSCDKSFYRDDDLRRHKIATHQKYFSCTLCNSTVLLEKSELVDHLKTVHATKGVSLTTDDLAKHAVNDKNSNVPLPL